MDLSPSGNEMTSVQSLAGLNQLILGVRQSAKALRESEQVSRLLEITAQALRRDSDRILEANTLDLEASLEMALPELIVEWLKLTPERLKSAILSVERLAYTDISVGSACGVNFHASSAAHAYLLGEPLGVVALIYEALPELAIIAAALCLRTGNGLILKGGHEASQTNQAIAEIFQTALVSGGFSEEIVLALSPSQGDKVRRWLMQTSALDLVIPYGRASLVQQVIKEANSPTLATTIGNCYLYWEHTGSLETVVKVVLDSQRGIPEAVNGIEKILVDSRVPDAAVEALQQHLKADGLFPKRVDFFPDENVTEREMWQNAQLDRSVILHRVDALDAAIALINQHSHGHADCIVTNSYEESAQFANQVGSSSIYVNASPRFSRNSGYAHAVALGMSPQKGVPGGRVGLNALLTSKAIIQGFAP